MQKCVFLLALMSVFLTALPASAGTIEEKTLFHKSQREYLVHLPRGYSKDRPWPVVLVFHGGGGNAEGIIRTTGLNAASDAYGFIAVYPEGSGPVSAIRTWNAGGCCGYAEKRDVDDVGFVSKLIDRLARDYNADRARIYATGHSNGGMMTYRLACELSHRIAAIAPNAAPQAGPYRAGQCTAGRAVPVLQMHGTADQCATYRAGKCGTCFADILGIGDKEGQAMLCRSVPLSVRAQAALNACSLEPEITLREGDVECITYRGCRDGATVGLCTAKGAGHTWAGGSYVIKACQRNPNGRLCKKWKKGVGEINRDVSFNDLMWGFFKDIRLPAGAGD